MSSLESVPGDCRALQEIHRDIHRNPSSGLDNSSGTNPPKGAENRDPLPNPLARGGNNQRQGSAANATPSNILDALHYMQLISDNPAVMQDFVNRSEAIAADPQMMMNLITQSPLFANSSQEIQEGMRTMLPQIMQVMANPNATMQTQQGKF